MDLILVRHGDSEAAAGLCIGHTDVALSSSGFLAIQRLAAQWQGEAPRFLFSSDLRRAQQSAQVFAARFATEPLADPRLREVPIVMITSRTGDKHRQRAFEIGVERYLGKPYQEAELMRNVFELLGLEHAGAGTAQ